MTRSSRSFRQLSVSLADHGLTGPTSCLLVIWSNTPSTRRSSLALSGVCETFNIVPSLIPLQSAERVSITRRACD